jgi:hypothetical protein
MIGLTYIKQRFSCIGEISDAGATEFAVDNNLTSLLNVELIDSDKVVISQAVSAYIDNNLLHPKSVNENGFSLSWNAEQIKSWQMVMARKYGIVLNEETSALLGLNVVKDNSNCW